MELNFRSDNESPAAPAILAAFVKANQGTAWAYAEDRWSARLDEAFSALFDTQTTVLPLSTGTVANSIALASVTPPWGSVYCHRNSHIQNDECGAPEFFGNGLRLVTVDGPDGKFSSTDLEKQIRANEGHGVHAYLPSAVSITQSTEAGTVYRPDEISAICRSAAKSTAWPLTWMVRGLAMPSRDCNVTPPTSPGAPACRCFPSARVKTAASLPRPCCFSATRN